MSKRSLFAGFGKPHRLLAFAITCLLIIGVGSIFHESLHLLISILATGRIATDAGVIGPFGLVGLRPVVYTYPSEIESLNALITPLTTALLGLSIALQSKRVDTVWLRRGVFVGGVEIWATDALYSMGVLTPPLFRDMSVVYRGDGVIVLESFGILGAVPGGLVLLTGILLLHNRVRLVSGES